MGDVLRVTLNRMPVSGWNEVIRQVMLGWGKFASNVHAFLSLGSNCNYRLKLLNHPLRIHWRGRASAIDLSLVINCSQF